MRSAAGFTTGVSVGLKGIRDGIMGARGRINPMMAFSNFPAKVKYTNNVNHDQENSMKNRIYLFAILSAALVTGTVRADYPIMNMVAENVINKYNNATCEQLWEQKAKPKTDEEKNLIQMLKGDPQMRTAFIDKVAAPIVNKMFTCGMIP